MFSHLFNTYEAVSPPPQTKEDFKQELTYDDPSTSYYYDNLWLGPKTRLQNVDKPPSTLFIEENELPFLEEPTEQSDGQLLHSPLISSIINTGRSFLGGKYVSGGTSPETGFDCSGFLLYIFKQNGINIPRDTSGIFKTGTEVSLNNVLPGDIICSKGSGPSGRHVQMVSRVGEDNLIYVIEAKGRKWGIVEGPLTKKRSDIISVRRILSLNLSDPFLSNLDIKSPSKKSSFPTKKSFVDTLNQGYRRALINHGLNPDYSYVLTAQAALESGWGKSQAGSFNFGGIKASLSLKGSYKRTREYSPSKGYYTVTSKFRDFDSIDDYCNARVTLLSNSRYNIFNLFNPNDVSGIVSHMLRKGYGTAPAGEYVPSVISNYNTVLNILKS